MQRKAFRAAAHPKALNKKPPYGIDPCGGLAGGGVESRTPLVTVGVCDLLVRSETVLTGDIQSFGGAVTDL